MAQNHTLNSDVALNYKYMFGQHRGPLPHLWNITVKQSKKKKKKKKKTVMNQIKGRFDDLNSEDDKQNEPGDRHW